VQTGRLPWRRGGCTFGGTGMWCRPLENQWFGRWKNIPYELDLGSKKYYPLNCGKENNLKQIL
jgi:hypothetical protein